MCRLCCCILGNHTVLVAGTEMVVGWRGLNLLAVPATGTEKRVRVVDVA